MKASALLYCVVLTALAALAGCAGAPRDELPAPEPMPRLGMAPRAGQSGGVFNPESTFSLTSDSRAFRVGDVVTVLLQETTQASKRAGTSYSKGSSLSLSPLTVAGKSVKTNVDLSGDRSFTGDATSTQQNALQGAITVLVQEVLPNGLLRVAGEKSLMLNQGDEFVRLAGYLRPGDIDADNQVSSLRIANAQIAYSARGALADANTPGWLTRFFTSPAMPF
jgi:flagellar L-ring protein precursor FlgH